MFKKEVMKHLGFFCKFIFRIAESYSVLQTVDYMSTFAYIENPVYCKNLEECQEEFEVGLYQDTTNDDIINEQNGGYISYLQYDIQNQDNDEGSTLTTINDDSDNEQIYQDFFKEGYEDGLFADQKNKINIQSDIDVNSLMKRPDYKYLAYLEQHIQTEIHETSVFIKDNYAILSKAMNVSNHYLFETLFSLAKLYYIGIEKHPAYETFCQTISENGVVAYDQRFNFFDLYVSIQLLYDKEEIRSSDMSLNYIHWIKDGVYHHYHVYNPLIANYKNDVIFMRLAKFLPKVITGIYKLVADLQNALFITYWIMEDYNFVDIDILLWQNPRCTGNNEFFKIFLLLNAKRRVVGSLYFLSNLAEES